MLPFDSCKDWSFNHLDVAMSLISDIATSEYNLECYPNQLEVITSEQMLESYSSVGMPLHYSHWSFGKQFVQEQDAYKKGALGLAYEIVINSNPCISYLMEENTLMMQTLVIAHACFGHNAFFRNNTHFKQWTDASAIIDYMSFAKSFIRQCEEEYGAEQVESVLDAAHTLQHHSVDRYKRPAKMSADKQKEAKHTRLIYDEQQVNDIWRTLPRLAADATTPAADGSKFPADPEENLLYFLEKHSPVLDDWKREILRIVRKISQYFYPQSLTKLMNEGFATFTHYNTLNELHARRHVTDGFMLEFIESHTSVITQRPYRPINPYALGFAMFQDIRRMCQSPTAEDAAWFPDLVGTDWKRAVQYAAYNFKDESFILQYLSPKVIRDFKLMHLIDDSSTSHYTVQAISDDLGYRQIREHLANQHNINNILPNISVVDVNRWGNRKLSLEHTTFNGKKLNKVEAQRVLRHVATLWGDYPIEIVTVTNAGQVLDTVSV